MTLSYTYWPVYLLFFIIWLNVKDTNLILYLRKQDCCKFSKEIDFLHPNDFDDDYLRTIIQSPNEFRNDFESETNGIPHLNPSKFVSFLKKQTKEMSFINYHKLIKF